MYVKICGLRDRATALHAIREGADAVGVVMSEGSPRNATREEAKAVVTAAHSFDRHIDAVLVVRRIHAADAAQLAVDLGFDVLQLHGEYTQSDFESAAVIHPRIWRAASLVTTPDLRFGEYSEERLLVDSPDPGSGRPWDLKGVSSAHLGDSWLLAGGLSPENVASAIAEAQPDGVDVSSGVEIAPGQKSLERITQFIRAARSASSN
ncbi:phosphoribosylanthranilate isomerase [Leucobacter denitrificans]|uniref:N-(5'-phosphoribosyl)anthranilate isomerase n=1 Tax=Leucobacter denitrificans TaxID=683042 RepID=A0A7G9S5V8_9MICO|nr:phosphoribosylanthranilate isomerase [Leucobacter denitrificans]QNN63233.1 phosphoribosylanthranilate isomerase [Leucobacter denitrificans]